MTFAEALKLLQDGKKVRLPEWMGYWQVVMDAAGDDHILVFTGKGEILTTIDTRSLFRKDWEMLPY